MNYFEITCTNQFAVLNSTQMYINKVGKINFLITNIIYIVLIDFLNLHKDNDDLKTEATKVMKCTQ